MMLANLSIKDVLRDPSDQFSGDHKYIHTLSSLSQLNSLLNLID